MALWPGPFFITAGVPTTARMTEHTANNAQKCQFALWRRLAASNRRSAASWTVSPLKPHNSLSRLLGLPKHLGTPPGKLQSQVMGVSKLCPPLKPRKCLPGLLQRRPDSPWGGRRSESVCCGVSGGRRSRLGTPKSAFGALQKAQRAVLGVPGARNGCCGASRGHRAALSAWRRRKLSSQAAQTAHRRAVRA